MFATDPERTLDEVEQRLCSVFRAISGAQYEVVRLIGEIARRDGHRVDGARTVAEWVTTRLAVDHTTAKRLCELAQKLQFLPALSRVFAAGELSFDQALAACWFATPELDEEVARQAPGLTPVQIEALGRELVPPVAHDAHRAYVDRRLVMRWRERRQVLELRGYLPADQGVVVERVLTDHARSQPTARPRVTRRSRTSRVSPTRSSTSASANTRPGTPRPSMRA